MNIRLLAAAIATSLIIAGSLIYNFGTPQAPDPVSPAGSLPAASAVSGADDAQATQPAEEAEALGQPAERTTSEALTEQPVEPPTSVKTEPVAADPRSPLAIEIPGCVCHSDDPKLVEQHKSYRMNQCSPCHNGRTPTGQE